MDLLRRSTPGLVGVIMLTACGTAVDGQPPGSTGDAFAQRARVVAQAWEASDALADLRSGFTPLQSLTIEPGWGASDALKYAFGNGWRSVRTTLPAGPANGTITYAGGETQDVALVSAQKALDLAMPQNAQPCRDVPPATSVPTTTPPVAPRDQTQPTSDDVVTSTGAPPCAVIVITAARFRNTEVVTSRGTARVPAWEFTVEGAGTPLVRVAVAEQEVTGQPMVDVPPIADNPGIATTQSLESTEGTALSFTIGVGACDKDVKGRAHETADFVIVGGTFTPPPADVACPAILKLQPVTVTLATPLGERLVVDASTGQPVGAPPA